MIRRLVAGLIAAILTATALPAAAQIRALSPSDRLNYTTAFDHLRRGDLDRARDTAREAGDRILLGTIEFERLFHADHAATFEELSAWLEAYADLPEAPRAYALAMRRRPDGAPEPRRPRGVDSEVGSDAGKAARIAFNAENLTGAYDTGVAIGDWWTAGLSAWRLGRFEESYLAFERVAENPVEDAWVRSGAAFWASRAAERAGRPHMVQPFLRLAARWPATFYGQIALRRLGVEPVIENLGTGPQPYSGQVVAAPEFEGLPEGLSINDLQAFVERDPQARRTVALLEVGRTADARVEYTRGWRDARDPAAALMWRGLGRALATELTPRNSEAERIDARRYPIPDIQPQGGFTIERSLVYAIARKETGFNPRAVSSAGAYGMMQVMPTTAAEMTGDRGFVTDPQRLFEAPVNMRLGQGYILRMLALAAFEGDLLRVVPSYNAGPGPMLGAVRKLGPDADPLLLIETIDVPQARDYVEKVVAAYWVYQRIQGRPLNTLDALASGADGVPLSLDFVPEPPAPATPPGETPAAEQPAPTQPTLRF
ncbi:lytic transglycosylase domain-containing protein [Brevundimonas sp.]|jgi:soluble lytic murein transglycosylase-like protein|uniref:lytic transglycosylase domain-containing protein n=1 Tax=Brevundimonas sp. TaxID=1871086 RepID=UPI002E0DE04D|nr:lytic transglycosylase domain-containing protein [Brevundimonas sp.]